VIVLLDSANTHKGEPLEEDSPATSRLRIENFPAYTPELNPDEGVWRQAKRKLANSCPKDIDERKKNVIRSIDQSTESTDRGKSCEVASRNPSSPLFCAIALFIRRSIAQAARFDARFVNRRRLQLKGYQNRAGHAPEPSPRLAL